MNDGKDVIIKKASSQEYSPFDDIRVESRGSYFVFRLGNYTQYSEAKRVLQKVQNISREAFVRKCDFLENRAVYIRNMEDNTKVSHKTKLFENNNIPIEELESRNELMRIGEDRRVNFREESRVTRNRTEERRVPQKVEKRVPKREERRVSQRVERSKKKSIKHNRFNINEALLP
jgi:hypothetical protein